VILASDVGTAGACTACARRRAVGIRDVVPRFDRSSALWGRDSRLTLRIPNVFAMLARTAAQM
jgi:hypothetical protein